jgi:hypothetical protein
MAVSGISGVESSGSVTRELIGSLLIPLLFDARSSEFRIKLSNFNQVDCDRFLPARVD